MSEENNIINIKDAINFQVDTTDENLNSDRFKKLDISSSQAANIDMLVSQLPQLAAAGTLSNAYVLNFPEGITGTLMKYKNGLGVGTPIIGENNKIVGHAAFQQIASTQAITLAAFSAMSIATGQYFLTQINSKLSILNQKIDKVLDFLYGDKKAELISEINFVQYAYKNFTSIMQHDDQRIATISGLQAARKVAMKDIEFYICDLDSKANAPAKSNNDFLDGVNDTFQIRDSLELSTQLYVMSSLMESFYSQNTDTEYINEIKNDTLYYINKCNSRILSDFSKLNGHLIGLKPGMGKKIDIGALQKKTGKIIEELTTGEESRMRKVIDSALDNSLNINTYYVNNKGEVYIAS